MKTPNDIEVALAYVIDAAFDEGHHTASAAHTGDIETYGPLQRAAIARRMEAIAQLKAAIDWRIKEGRS